MNSIFLFKCVGHRVEIELGPWDVLDVIKKKSRYYLANVIRAQISKWLRNSRGYFHFRLICNL